jgi:hypothetical protein
MNYELWHVDSDELVGTLEVPRHVDHAPGALVTIKVEGTIEHPVHGKCNAIQVRVCRMKREGQADYWALETNLPFPLLKMLEGFAPKIIVPRATEIPRLLQ